MGQVCKADLVRVRKLCLDFYEDIQSIFDDMTEATYETEVCQAALAAQGYAKEAIDAD